MVRSHRYTYVKNRGGGLEFPEPLNDEHSGGLVVLMPQRNTTSRDKHRRIIAEGTGAQPLRSASALPLA